MNTQVPIIERNNLDLEMPDSFALYQGSANPNGSGQVSWTQFMKYPSKASAVKVMRVLFEAHGGLWLIMRETPMVGYLPEPDQPEPVPEAIREMAAALVPETERYVPERPYDPEEPQ